MSSTAIGYCVFLDTQVIVSANFDYRSRTFRTLALLAAYKKVTVLLSDVTVAEVKSNIREEVQKAHAAFQSLQSSKTRIVRNINGPLNDAVRTEFDVNGMVDALTGQFVNYLKEVKAVIIPYESGSIREVFESYFAKRAPFAAEKKKSEFPDAFTLSAIKGWQQTHKVRVNIVSADPDFRSYCKGDDEFRLFEKLEEFLDYLYKTENEPYYSFVNELVDEHSGDIEESIENEFYEVAFNLDEEQGEVHSVDAEYVGIIDKYSVQVDKESAVIRLSASVRYSAEVSWMWEPAPGYPRERIDDTIEGETDVTVEVRVRFRLGDRGAFSIDYVLIDDQTITLRRSEDYD